MKANRRAATFWAPQPEGDGFDLLLTPTLGEPPVAHGTFDSTAEDPLGGFFRSAAFVPFTAQFNVSGQPAINLPLHWNDDGLPIGVQLVAAFGREDLLLRVAASARVRAALDRPAPARLRVTGTWRCRHG